MSKKEVSIGKRPTRPSAEDVDKWMAQNSPEGEGQASPVIQETTGPPVEVPAPAAPVVKAPTPVQVVPKMKRLTIDIPDSLHRRVKSRCGQDGLRMADVIRELLDQRFPDTRD